MEENRLSKALTIAIEALKRNNKIRGDIEVAEKLGMSRGTLSAYKSGLQSPSKNFVSNFQNTFGINLNEVPLDDKVEVKQKRIISGMPVYESAPMTLTNVESYRDEKQEAPDFWLNIPQYRKCTYACRAKGDSMHPVIRNHALVGGKEITDMSVIIFGDIYIIHTRNGIETIKYIHPDPDNPENILLVPYNGNAKTTPIHKSDILRLYQAEFVINPL